MGKSHNSLTHLGIIMDGNRRWARSRGLPALYGHKKGVETLKKVGVWCIDNGIKFLTVWAFSTENWGRPKKEVSFLMKLLKQVAIKEIDFFMKKGVQLKIIGRLKELPQETQDAITKAVQTTKNNKNVQLNIAINYGGRVEIVDAVKRIIKEKINPDRITESLFGKFLYEPALPSPELVIRTGGQVRTSGFMLWETPYTEWYFTKKKWPEFNEHDLQDAIEDFQGRQRNFGK